MVGSNRPIHMQATDFSMKTLRDQDYSLALILCVRL